MKLLIMYHEAPNPVISVQLTTYLTVLGPSIFSSTLFSESVLKQ